MEKVLVENLINDIGNKYARTIARISAASAGTLEDKAMIDESIKDCRELGLYDFAGQIALANGKYNDAKRLYLKDNNSYYCSKAAFITAYISEDYKTAEKVALRALKDAKKQEAFSIFPTWSNIFGVLLGNMYKDTGELRKAKEVYERIGHYLHATLISRKIRDKKEEKRLFELSLEEFQPLYASNVAGALGVAIGYEEFRSAVGNKELKDLDLEQLLLRFQRAARDDDFMNETLEALYWLKATENNSSLDKDELILRQARKCFFEKDFLGASKKYHELVSKYNIEKFSCLNRNSTGKRFLRKKGLYFDSILSYDPILLEGAISFAKIGELKKAISFIKKDPLREMRKLREEEISKKFGYSHILIPKQYINHLKIKVALHPWIDPKVGEIRKRYHDSLGFQNLMEQGLL